MRPWAAMKKLLKCVPFLCVVIFAFIFFFSWIYDVARSSAWSASKQKQIFAKQSQHSETVLTISLRAQRRQSGRRVCLCLTDSLEIGTYPRNIHFSVAFSLSPCHSQQNDKRRNGKKPTAKAKTNKNRYMCVSLPSLLCRRVRSHTFEKRQPACGSTSQQAKVPPIRFSSSRHQQMAWRRASHFSALHTCDKDRRTEKEPPTDHYDFPLLFSFRKQI